MRGISAARWRLLLAVLANAALGGCRVASPSAHGETAPSLLSYASPQIYRLGATITPLAPKVTGTVGRYRVDPALPAGLALDPATGTVGGTPAIASTGATYVVSAANSGGTSSFPLTLIILPAPPAALRYPSPQTYRVGDAINPLSPRVSGSVMSYSVAPALPAGLRLDTATGQISGSPRQDATLGRYRVTASNLAGTTSFRLELSVTASPPPMPPMPAGPTSEPARARDIGRFAWRGESAGFNRGGTADGATP